MARTSRNSSTPVKVTSIVVATKKARLISKELDRSPSQVSPKIVNFKSGLKTHAKRHSNKSRGMHQKKFKFAPSNYEANLKITHSLSSTLSSEKLAFPHVKNVRQGLYKRLPAANSERTPEVNTAALQRTFTQRYQPRKFTADSLLHRQRAHLLRVGTTYSAARFLLASAPRARAGKRGTLYNARTARPFRWTAKKRTALLYMPDVRKLGRRSRRKSKPRVGLNPLRAQLAKQLIRKFRASRSARHTALRRRLIRFRWFNRKFLKGLKYPFRKRLLRRSIRRASRYLQTTAVVLAGATQRHRLSRKRFRVYRSLAQHTEIAANSLLRNKKEKLSQRQQFFSHQQLTRKAHALRLLEAKNRLLHSVYRAKSGYARSKPALAARKLERKLTSRRSLLAISSRPAYRSSGLLQRQTALRVGRWLKLRGARTQKRGLFNKKHLVTSFLTLQRFNVRRRVLRLTRQRQQPQPLNNKASCQLYPKVTSTHYSERYQRLQFKFRSAAGLTPNAASHQVLAGNYLPEATALTGVDGLTLWRPVEAPVATERFQLPNFARNRALRGRAIAIYARANTTGFKGTTLPSRREANITLRLQHSRMLEKRFYRQHPTLRLPRTIVKRAEIRRSGARLFARNTVKSPETWVGKRNLLLPVSKSYTPVSRNSYDSSIHALTDLRHVRRAIADHPKVWARGPGYHESALVYDIRDKKRNAAVRATSRAAKLRARKVITPDSTKTTTIVKRLDNSTRVDTAQKANYGTAYAVTTKLALFRESILRAGKYNSRRRLGQYAPLVSGCTVGRTVLRLTAGAVKEKKQSALWHLRSVQKMLTVERRLAAWSPQYPTRWRRWSSPRFEGSPAARRWPSRKLLRQRAMINAALVYRGRPKRKHFDKAYSHLQYHRGSAPAIGYDRFRRVHRARSKNNRWWKPTTCPTPFSNPFSRRSINARKHITKRLARQHVAGVGETGTRTRTIKGAWFPIAQPARVISSQNFEIKPRRLEGPRAFKLREKAERAKLPATLQRWTVRAEKYQLGSTSSPRKTVTLLRNNRTLRRLEALYPRINTWASHNWQNLDVDQKNTSAASLYATACRQLPASFWNSLYQRYNTQAVAIAAKSSVFTKFSAWYKQLPLASSQLSSSSLLLRAVQCIISTTNALNAAHNQLETQQYRQAVAGKESRFWRLRELPRLHKGLKRKTSVLHKSNGTLYKQWLRGAARYLKRGRISYLPPKHGRGGSGLITNFGRNQRRFPAAGRRRHSYDAMLHAFARRSAPAGFRRVNNLRFKQLTGKIDAGYKTNLRLHELTPLHRRQRTLTRKLGLVTYLSSSWRELLAYRAASPIVPTEGQKQLQGYAQPFGASVKRRFAVLPTKVLFKKVLASCAAARAKNSITQHAQRTGLLRTALRRRRQERVFIDLKKHITRRKLPKEELSAPWRRKKSARRKEQHTRYGDWSPRHFQLQQSKAVFWTLHDLEERVPRRRDRTRVVLSQSPCNELFTLPTVVPKKLAWVKQGFQVAPRMFKSHRRVRRERKRRRRGRSGITKERRARFHHTSERRNFALLKKISGRSSRNLLEKIKAKGQKFAAARTGTSGHYPIEIVPLARRHWRRPAQRALLVLTQRSLALNAKKLLITPEQVISPQALLPFTSAIRHKKLQRLDPRVNENRNKFTKRAFTALKRSITHRPAAAKSLKEAPAQLLRAFTASALAPSPTVPLAFQKPTKLFVKSEAEKKRAVVWNIQSKERRYKRTAQYAESLTAYIPKLVSHMFSQRIKNSSVSFESAKTLISATYWNLRIYLNVDPFERRLALRDSNFAFLRFLTSSVSMLAKKQTTEHADRTRLRKRFQSCRVHPAPTSDRFRLDWLRVFFPRKHALFQEDPEEYASIPVSTRNIRRLIPSGYGIGRWRTAPAGISLERRARQLLRLRLSKCTPRLETLLQTIRRIPLTEIDALLPEVNSEGVTISPSTQQSGGKTKAYAIKYSGAELGLSTHKCSFFRRQYTTQSVRTAIGVSRYISRRSRLLTSDQNATSAFVAVASRYQLKGRAEARGRSSFTAHARWTLDAGGLDPRFLRFKSPRSRQYLVRLPADIIRRSDQEKLARFLALRDLREHRNSEANKKSFAKSCRLRTSRRYFYNNRPPADYYGALTKIRRGAFVRRRPAFLQARGAGVADVLSAGQVYNFPNRRQLTFISAEAHGQLNIAHVNSTQNKPQLIVENARSVLQYRAGNKRVTRYPHKRDRVLRKLPYSLNSSPKRGVRAGKKASSLLSKLEDKRSIYLRLLRFAPVSKKGSYQVLFARAQRTLQRARNRLATLSLRSETRFGQEAKLLALTPFDNNTFHYLASHRRFTKNCMRLQSARREMIFDTSRPRLWHKLTSRWMKKERLMRNWLKGVKRWFRDPWLSKSVDITRPDTRHLLPGEIRSREQQVGEVVTGDENSGLTVEEDLALQKAALPAIAAAQKVVDADSRRAYELSKRAGALQKKVIRVRSAASQEALRTARPSMWLADLQAKKKTAELAIWRTKTRQEKDAIRLSDKEAAIARAKGGLPPLAAKKDPLKMPADHWMPSIVWKDIQRRARRLEWRESDDVFARKGFRNAFRFYPGERNRAPWLESLMYNRSLFSTRLREFRRRQFPKEQKKYKWLQRVRKSLFPGRTHVYIKGRRWPRLRMYNQRLHYTLFNLPNRGAARRHFAKLNRRSRKVGFVHSQEGLSNRLDNVLIHLNMAPTIFWARTVAPHGLLRVNGVVVTQADFLFKAGDFIEPIWSKVLRFRNFFTCPLNRNEEVRRHKRFSLSGVPKNLRFHRGIRCFTFFGNPREGDLRSSSRLQPHLFRWFRLDSV